MDPIWEDFYERHPLPEHLRGLEYATSKAIKAGWKSPALIRKQKLIALRKKMKRDQVENTVSVKTEDDSVARANEIWSKQLEKLERDRQAAACQQLQPVYVPVQQVVPQQQLGFVDKLLLAGASIALGWIVGNWISE